MKAIVSMLVATILSLYTFYAACWYAPSPLFNLAIPLVFAALFAYFLTVYALYRSRCETF